MAQNKRVKMFGFGRCAIWLGNDDMARMMAVLEDTVTQPGSAGSGLPFHFDTNQSA